MKNGRLNGKLKRVDTGLKKETESPFRKVVVTTDLRSDSRPSKTSYLSSFISNRRYREKNPKRTRQWCCGKQWGSKLELRLRGSSRLGHSLSCETSRAKQRARDLAVEWLDL